MSFASDDQRKAVMAKLNGNNGVSSNSIEIDVTVPQQTQKNKMLQSNKFGKGAIVKVIKPFGINDVAVGTKGVVMGHPWGKSHSPEVMFEGINRRYVPGSDVLEIIQGSSKFPARNTEEILFPKSKEEIAEILHDYNRKYPFINWDDDNSFWGSIYSDNGEGVYGDSIFHGKIKDGRIEVKMNKSDVPRFWRDTYYDQIFEEAVEKVKEALGANS